MWRWRGGATCEGRCSALQSASACWTELVCGQTEWTCSVAVPLHRTLLLPPPAHAGDRACAVLQVTTKCIVFCYIKESFPSVLYLAHQHANSFEGAVVAASSQLAPVPTSWRHHAALPPAAVPETSSHWPINSSSSPHPRPILTISFVVTPCQTVSCNLGLAQHIEAEIFSFYLGQQTELTDATCSGQLLLVLAYAFLVGPPSPSRLWRTHASCQWHWQCSGAGQ